MSTKEPKNTYRLKKTKVEESVVNAYKQMEENIVRNYLAMEHAFVNGYQHIEDKFVERFLEVDNKNEDDNENSSKNQ